MFRLRTHVVICLALFAALIAVPVLGNALAGAGMIRPLHGAAQKVMLGVILALFLAAGLSAIPVMVITVLRTASRPHQTALVWVMWILILAGAAVALPAAIAGGAFDAADAGAVRSSGAAPP